MIVHEPRALLNEPTPLPTRAMHPPSLPSVFACFPGDEAGLPQLPTDQPRRDDPDRARRDLPQPRLHRHRRVARAQGRAW